MKRPSVYLIATIASLLTVTALIASSARPGQAAWTFVSFDVPGSTGTFPLDINAGGDVVGSTTIAGLTHGFLRTADGTITTVDYPGALATFASGINPDGVIVGFYGMG